MPAFPAPRLLVSVRDPAEAETALLAGADLIDAKDPENGALGALGVQVVREIVARLRSAGNDAVATSAVADGPDTAAAMAATGVDWVKVGLARGPWTDGGALARIAAAAPGRVIAVLFAEDEPGAEHVPALAAAGFAGAMIDTAGKAGVRLPDLVDPMRLSAFTAACRAHGLMSGLAGSLRITDIPALAAHRPDYLGFRGGLCRDLDRRNGVDPLRIAEAAGALRPVDRDAA